MLCIYELYEVEVAQKLFHYFYLHFLTKCNCWFRICFFDIFRAFCGGMFLINFHTLEIASFFVFIKNLGSILGFIYFLHNYGYFESEITKCIYVIKCPAIFDNLLIISTSLIILLEGVVVALKLITGVSAVCIVKKLFSYLKYFR